jgi:23S rRNA pseudouridine1911/1915/1917 synthase
MSKEKAYKLLAFQENISNNKAKELIDRGLVYVGDQKVKIARADISDDTKFRIEMPQDISIIYEDDFIVAVDKPAFVESYDIEKIMPNLKLLHRLDRETSGILLLSKDEVFSKEAVLAFKDKKVTKEYVAWVDGIIYEEQTIDLPISTFKKGGSAFSKIDAKNGKSAKTVIKPLEVQGKKSKIDITIDTGRTHQIRVHLAHMGYPIVGDEKYGSRTKAKRVLLHAKRIALLGYDFTSPEPKDIARYK